jgi:hypothetical protein
MIDVSQAEPSQPAACLLIGFLFSAILSLRYGAEQRSGRWEEMSTKKDVGSGKVRQASHDAQAQPTPTAPRRYQTSAIPRHCFILAYSMPYL